MSNIVSGRVAVTRRTIRSVGVTNEHRQDEFPHPEPAGGHRPRRSVIIYFTSNTLEIHPGGRQRLLMKPWANFRASSIARLPRPRPPASQFYASWSFTAFNFH